MDQHRLDDLARALARGKTRRRVLASVAGAALAAVGIGRSATNARAFPGFPGWDTSGVACGGIAGLPCPPGYECDIDWDDPECSTDCLGVCRRPPGDPPPTDPCAAITCAVGSVCCSSCGGICIPQGVPCSDDLCVGEPCGPNVCGVGEYCCNESCGHCAPIGGSCTMEICEGEPCGPNACGPDEYCCNESCGTCAPIGGACTEEFCGEPCGDTVCGIGEYCCNESCSICAPEGGFCIQMACL